MARAVLGTQPVPSFNIVSGDRVLFLAGRLEIDVLLKSAASVESTGSDPSAAALDFATRLQSGDTLEHLRGDVLAYQDEIKADFRTDVRAVLDQLFDILLDRGALMRRRLELCSLVEGPFPPV